MWFKLRVYFFPIKILRKVGYVYINNSFKIWSNGLLKSIFINESKFFFPKNVFFQTVTASDWSWILFLFLDPDICEELDPDPLFLEYQILFVLRAGSDFFVWGPCLGVKV